MKIIKLAGSILDRHLAEAAQARVAEQQALIDYNIMMGVLEDPSEDDDEGDEDDE